MRLVDHQMRLKDGDQYSDDGKRKLKKMFDFNFKYSLFVSFFFLLINIYNQKYAHLFTFLDQNLAIKTKILIRI